MIKIFFATDEDVNYDSYLQFEYAEQKNVFYHYKWMGYVTNEILFKVMKEWFLTICRIVMYDSYLHWHIQNERAFTITTSNDSWSFKWIVCAIDQQRFDVMNHSSLQYVVLSFTILICIGIYRTRGLLQLQQVVIVDHSNHESGVSTMIWCNES